MAAVVSRHDWTCEHERWERNRAEPDVGIFRPYVECLDCGVTASFTIELDGDEYGEWATLVADWPTVECPGCGEDVVALDPVTGRCPDCTDASR